MNETVIQAHAHYLIEDRVRPTRRAASANARRRHPRFPKLSWL